MRMISNWMCAIEELVRVIKAMAPGFGGINLEDIKAPDCFVVEEALRNCVDIPVFTMTSTLRLWWSAPG